MFATISSSPALAQGRYYVWNYRYDTEEADEFELESYSFFAAPSLSNNVRSLDQQFEIEYGITDRIQVGLYQVFGRDYPDKSESFSAKSSMIEVLYKLAGQNEFPVDPLLYVEYAREWDRRNSNQAELKLILSKDFGRLNGTVNGIAEYEFGGRNDLVPELSAGISYRLTDNFRAGVETFASLSDESVETDEDWSEGFRGHGLALGPTLSFSTQWFSIASGACFGISRNSSALNFCTVIGIDL